MSIQVWRRPVNDDGSSGSPREALRPQADPSIYNSLNDVSGNAPPQGPDFPKSKFPGTASPAPESPAGSPPLPDSIKRPENVIGFVPKGQVLFEETRRMVENGDWGEDQEHKWNQEAKRSHLNRILKDHPGQWDIDSWDFIELWKKRAPDVFNLESYDGKLYRQEIYNQCYAEFSEGYVEILDDGSARGRKSFLCNEPGCLYCDQKKRGALAREWIEIVQRVVNFNPGFPGLLSLVFTLPEEIEADPVQDPKLETALKKAVQNTVRWIFGRKSRSNIFLRLSIHPVGDRDLYRDRWHVHVNVIPAEVQNGQFFWLSPRWPWGALDYGAIGEEWNSHLQEIFGRELEAINPQVSFIRFPQEGEYDHQKQFIDEVQKFWGRFSHRFRYDIRSFAGDIEKAVLRTEFDQEKIILKAENAAGIYWRMVDPVDLIARYQFIRAQNLQQVLGWGRALKKYEMILFGEPYKSEIEEGEEGDPEAPAVVAVVDAECEMVLGRYWDATEKKVKFVRSLIFHYTDPDTGDRKTIMDSALEGMT